jgi:hypothetical protein
MVEHDHNLLNPLNSFSISLLAIRC